MAHLLSLLSVFSLILVLFSVTLLCAVGVSLAGCDDAAQLVYDESS